MSSEARRVNLQARPLYGHPFPLEVTEYVTPAEDGAWALLPWKDYETMREILSRVTGEILAKRVKMQLQGDLKLVEGNDEQDDT